ncbi:crotonase/enoyl-CoA hydratase family protein [Xenophilus aerolatus]|nr:crotonase/enoyl-CoA hydratase family protein [Xenophilus aerolatus]
MTYIHTEKRGYVLLITIDRPDARNAFNRQMALDLESALDDYEADPALRVAILQAKGPVFCSGQDLKAAAKGEFSASHHRGGFGIMAKPPEKPLMAAVEGQVLAGGMEITLCCDLIIASSAAVFGLAEAKRSLVATGGACFRLPRRLPYPIAMEMLLTAQTKSAEEMRQHGYVNRVVEPGGALEAALAIAEIIAANGPLAVRLAKKIAWDALAERWPESEAWDRQDEIVQPLLDSHDLKEGLAAFAEKRPAVWLGR